MKDLEKMFDEAIDIVAYCIGSDKIEKINRPIHINTRAMRRWGMCTRHTTGGHDIEISSRILEDNIPDYATMETIIHEILHACKNGSGHKGTWKHYANIINRKTHYHITRTTSADSFGLQEEQLAFKMKYGCKCKTCGRIVYKSRMTNFIKHPDWYSHKNCGGTFKRVL